MTEPVGTTSPVQTATLTFTASGTLGTIAVLTQGAPNLDFVQFPADPVAGQTCIVGTAYTVGETCTVTYTFTPTHPGARYGGVTLTTIAGALLANSYISGVGTGPQVIYSSNNVQSTLSGGLYYPYGIAVDGSGNVFFVKDNTSVEEILAAGGYTTINTLPVPNGSFSNPSGLAVDGSGNVFVADTSKVKEILAAGGYTNVISLGSGFNDLTGVTVDGSGNVFVADEDNNAVKEILASGGYNTINTLGSGFSHPVSVALDGSGNVFVTEYGDTAVKEILAAGGYATVNTLPVPNGSFHYLAGVAVDAAGNVFVASSGNSANPVKEILASGGYSTIVTLGGSFGNPQFIALDGSGNIFVADGVGGPNVFKLDYTDPPTLTFEWTAVGSTSYDSPQTVTISNDGNMPLAFTVPSFGYNPSITPGFTIGSGSTCPQLTTASNVATLAAGTTCTDVVSFTPIAPGLDNGELVSTDNNLNVAGAIQIVPLNGTGTGALLATTTPLTVLPNPAAYGQQVQMSATVTPTAVSGFTPSGTVEFFDNGALLTTVVVSGGGSVVLNWSALPLGTNTITCVYSGDTKFAGSICNSVQVTITPATTTQTITFPQPASPAYPDTVATLTATASSGLPVTYTVLSGPAIVSGSYLLYTGTGTVVVQASQAGNSIYSAATPVPVTVSVIPVSQPVGMKSQIFTGIVTISSPGAFSKVNILTQGAANLDFNSVLGGSVDVVVPGCAPGTIYAVGQTCSVLYTFTPTHPGMRYGGITLTTSTGALLGNGFVSGIGTGPQIVWSPGMQSVLNGGVILSRGVAMDGSGNAFVSDFYNNVVTEAFAAGGYTNNITLPIPSGSFYEPRGMAVDGIGDVFVADSSHNAVKEIMAAGGYTTVTTIGSGFSFPSGVVVDGSGNVFVANGIPGAIYEVLAASGYQTVKTISSGLPQIWGLAMDSSGNIFVALAGNNPIKEILAAGGYTTINTIAGNGAFNSGAIAVDAAGNLFVGSDGNTGNPPGSLIEIFASSSYTTYQTLLTGADNYSSVVLDGRGNVFLTADSSGLNELDYSDPPSLTFANTPVGQTSSDSPQKVTISNDGNAGLLFIAPTSGTFPQIASGFRVGSGSTCPVLTPSSTSVTMAPGGSCSYSVNFMPLSAISYSGDLEPVTNNLNTLGGFQMVPLIGTGTAGTLLPTVTGISPNTGPATGGTSVTITGKNFTGATAVSFGGVSAVSPQFISDTTMTATSPGGAAGPVDVTVTTAAGTSAANPADQFTYTLVAQTITFTQPYTAYAGISSPLIATGGASGNPVVFSVVSGPATISSVNGSVITYTGVGTVVIEADQAGNGVYAAAAPVQHTVNITVLTEPVGTASVLLQEAVIFSASGTLGSAAVLTQGAVNLDFGSTQGGTVDGSPCTPSITYTAGQFCTVAFTFKPTHPGMRYGGITLTTSTGALLGNGYIYGIGQGPQVIWSPGLQTALGSGFYAPGGIAVDGNGNIFVADGGNKEVKEIPAGGGSIQILGGGSVEAAPLAIDGNGNLFVVTGLTQVKEIVAAGGYTTVNVLPANGVNWNFDGAQGIAVDGSGNVYVAGPGVNGDSVAEIFAAGGYTSFQTLSTSFSGATSIAVDGNGNVFVGDQTGGSVQEILAVNGSIPASPTIVPLPGAHCNNNYIPWGLAVDSNSNLYIACGGMQGIQEVMAAGGYTTVNSLGSSPFNSADGVTVDGSGNVYVADTGNNRVVKLDYSDPPSLTFANTPVGQTSSDSPQKVTMTNNGNESLVFSLPVTSYNPSITAGFVIDSNSTCPQQDVIPVVAVPLGPGASCTDVISFKPVVVGPVVNGKMVTTDNALNGANVTQTVPLNGTGTGAGLIATTSMLVVTPPGPLAAGQTVTLTATVTPTVISSPSPALTGTVLFYDNGILLVSIPLTGSTGTVGIVGYTPQLGTNTFTCVYSGDSNYASSSCNSQTVLVDGTTPQTITFSPLVQTAYAGTSVLLTATASSGLAVTFSVVSGPASVSGLNGEILTYTGAGTVVVEADQAGNSTYAAAPPKQQTVSPIVLTEPVGTTSPTVTTLVPFGASGTVAAINVMTQGATNLDFNFVSGFTGGCAVGQTFSAGGFCEVAFNFTPTHPGLRFGGITLTTSLGAILANSYIYGFGTGPQVNWSPGKQLNLGTAIDEPSGVAVDGNGNVFVSEYGNGVAEIAAGTGVTTMFGPFTAADDVAVDGSGNVFVASDRTTVSEIMAVNGSIPATPAIRTISTGFTALNGMKVDGNGNVFLANSFTTGDNCAIYEIPAVDGSIPATPTVLTLVTSFGASTCGPTGVAIDQAGDLFVSDELSAAVYEVLAVNGSIPASPTVRTLGSGFSEPTNVVVDDAGNVFVTDYGNATVKEIVAVNGSIPATNPTILSLGSGFVMPQGLAVDASGNVFVADSGLTQIVKLDFADLPSLTFATTPVGQTSSDSPQTVTMVNEGNVALIFSPVSGVSSQPTITAGFLLASNSSCIHVNAGSLNTPLYPGQSCTDVVSFMPVVAGSPVTGYMTTTDNNLNGTNVTQIVPLSGDATDLAPTIVFNVANQVYGTPPFTVAATSNSTGAFTYSVVSGPATIAGNVVTLTGVGPVELEVVQAASGIYTSGTAYATFNVSKEPQTINFTAPVSPVNYGVPPITLVATASSGLPVTFSVLSGPGTVSGNILTITGGCGTVVVAADQAGNAFYAPAPEVTHSILLNGCVPTITLTAAPNPVFLLNPVTLAATLASASGTPTGTVQFLDSGNPIGTCMLNGGVAAISVSTFSVGSHPITAVYGGDGTYSPVTSSIAVVIVQDFTLTITNPLLTIPHGGTATYAIVLTSIGGVGMAANINLAVSGTPDSSTVAFTPASVPTGSGTTNVTLTIKTPDYPVGPWGEASLGLLAAVGLLLTLGRKRLRIGRLGCVLLLLAASSAACTALTGCGWGWGPQHYNLTVTGSSGALTRSASARFTSQ